MGRTYTTVFRLYVCLSSVKHVTPIHLERNVSKTGADAI